MLLLTCKKSILPIDRLHVLGLETLECRRLVHDLILCYKFRHGLIERDKLNRIFCVFMSYLEPEAMALNYTKPCSCSIDARKHCLQVVQLTFEILAAVFLTSESHCVYF